MPEETTTPTETPKRYHGFALSLLSKRYHQHYEALSAAWNKAIGDTVCPRKLYRHKIITGQIEPLAHITLQNILIDRFKDGQPETLELSDIFRSHPEVSRAKEIRAAVEAKMEAAIAALEAQNNECEIALMLIDVDPNLDNTARFQRSMEVVEQLRNFKLTFPEAVAPAPAPTPAPTKGKKKGAKKKTAGTAAPAAPAEPAAPEPAVAEPAAPEAPVEATSADPLG